jgi:hypothetical protein
MVAVLCAIALLSPVAVAQQAQGPQDVAIPVPAPMVWMSQGDGPVAVSTDGTFTFVSAEMSIDGKTVKGAPFSAQIMNEHIQMLADGNRIVRRDTGAIYRDSEGRTRREQQFAAVGPFAASKEPAHTIVINDPVAGVSYFLNSSDRTAQRVNRMVRERARGPAAVAVGPMMKKRMPEGETNVVVAESGKVTHERVTIVDTEVHERHASTKVHATPHQPAWEGKTESLGKQMVEGVEAEGTRRTRTIPAGEFGNEQPILIVNEQWYSPHLQTVVLSKRSDPRFGETTHRLVNIQLGEPPAAMLQVPSDYTIQEKGPRRIEMRRPRVADKKQEEN